MTVWVNGDEAPLAAGATVHDVLAHVDLPRDAAGVAVAVDAEVVPRGAWGSFVLADGARVEVLTATQGG